MVGDSLLDQWMEILGYIVLGTFGFFMTVAVIGFVSSFFQNKTQPKLAGTFIPELGEGLDIQKRYDILYTGGDYGSQVMEKLEGVRIIGYVGKDEDETVDKMYIRSRWLVVDYEDGRKAYLMPQAIISLQETRSNSLA